MSHVTSDRFLFDTEHNMITAMEIASDALLIALQREHPRIVDHLQAQAERYKASNA